MRAAAGLPLLAAAGALLVVSLLFGGGSGQGRLFWIGSAAVVAATVAVAGSLLGLLPRPSPTRRGWAALVLVAAFVLWNGLTMAWSIAPDRSWDYFNRGLVYVALAVLGLYGGALLRRPAEATAGSLAILLGGVLGWALLGKVFPGLFPDGARVARLRNPVGYWNALALLAAVAMPLALWLATAGRPRRAARAAGALLLYGAVIALVLTYSRAGIAVAVFAVLLWLVLSHERFDGLLVAFAAVPPAAAVSGWASTRPGLVDDLQSKATRESDGGWFALALVLGTGVALVLLRVGSTWAERQVGEARRLWFRRLAAAVVVAGVAGVVVVSAASGGPGKWLQEFRGRAEVAQSSGRLGELSSNNRWTWWKEAARLFDDSPAGGKGAHTFEIARRPIRDSSVVTTEPHNVALQFLTETGVPGFLLGAAASVAALLACVEALRRLGGRERAGATALAVALPVYLLHALADIDWDYVAVTGPLFLGVGVLLAAGREPRGGTPRFMAASFSAAVALAVLYSLVAPWLSNRKVDDVYAAIERNDSAAAISAARDARSLNPLSPQPLWAWANAEAAQGDAVGAIRQYQRATKLQPSNSDTWLALGAYELRVGRYKDAYRDLNHTYTLDRYGPVGLKGGLLDQARAKAGLGQP